LVYGIGDWGLFIEVFLKMPQVGIKMMRRSLWIGLGLVLLFLCGSCLVSAAPAADAGEFLNDEEFEGFEALEKPNVQVIPEGGKPETPASKPAQKQSPQDAESQSRSSLALLNFHAFFLC
jgi:hypothetical protein